MIDVIETPVAELYEFDLSGLDLQDHFLVIDEEGCYILYKEYRFFLLNEFFQDSNIIYEESSQCPPIIVTNEQKDAIKESILKIARLNISPTNLNK